MSTLKIRFSDENIRKVKLQPFMQNYQDFKNFLHNNYAQFLIGKFTLKYLDDEDDFISVSNQIEWETMFDERRHASVVHLHCVFDEVNEEESDDFESDVEGDSWDEFDDWCDADEGDFMFMRLHQRALEMMKIGDRDHLQFARELLMNAVKIKPVDPIAFYNLACVESLLGNLADATRSLNTAIKFGYSDVMHMLLDVDLENIRDTAGFQDCVAFFMDESSTEESSTSESSDTSDTSESSDTSEFNFRELDFEFDYEDDDSKVGEFYYPQMDLRSTEEISRVSQVSTILHEMGIWIDEDKLSNLVLEQNFDATQVIQHYFNHGDF
eukprot:TRINITY_DN481_c0_g1_i2.p1 TRINITY_DN481_c0_g1~~TRINITY_DN481_c0_g1_i2.p1  ORF type:complete len:338 (+),score=104.83 TRINITY_DN481_c0_g1_i2:41-1015(+)